MKVALSLGSNKGNRKSFLFRAIKELLVRNVISSVECSTFFENAALLLDGSPSDWDCDFINCVVVGKTMFTLQKLFYSIKEIEKFLGRESGRRWAPREIDIDILLYGDKQVQNNECIIPHIGMLERDFVLLPLKEVAPNWLYVGEGKYKNVSIANIVKGKYGL